ncbi:MAG TPA: bacteriocin-protection protein, partial [Archangium sp.]
MKKSAASDYERVEIASRAELRRWLQAHHRRSRGAWVVAFKKKVQGKHVSTVEIGEEALCFGWIDSLPRALDDERSMLLITPRKPKSNWSKVNKDRVARLTAAGL